MWLVTMETLKKKLQLQRSTFAKNVSVKNLSKLCVKCIVLCFDYETLLSHWSIYRRHYFLPWDKLALDLSISILTLSNMYMQQSAAGAMGMWLFGHKPKYWRNKTFWSDEGATWRVKGPPKLLQMIRGDRVINFCTIFNSNPSNAYWGISVWTKVAYQPTGRPRDRQSARERG